ncbi:MAG: hypothetical protein IKI39_04695 [Oscillospiraceae bacterium]|nr:hypothetical protein [Oscillospiraceae bacterium]
MEEKRIEVFIPRGSDREDPNLFVGINGVNYLLPRGKKSKVPAAVAAEIKRADLAADRFYQSVDVRRQSV